MSTDIKDSPIYKELMQEAQIAKTSVVFEDEEFAYYEKPTLLFNNGRTEISKELRDYLEIKELFS